MLGRVLGRPKAAPAAAPAPDIGAHLSKLNEQVPDLDKKVDEINGQVRALLPL